MSFDRCSWLAAYDPIGKLDFELPQMLRITFRAAVLLQQPLARLMNLFHDRVFKILRHRFHPAARKVYKQVEARNPPRDILRKPTGRVTPFAMCLQFHDARHSAP